MPDAVGTPGAVVTGFGPNPNVDAENPYTTYRVKVKYRRATGLLAAPIAPAPGQTQTSEVINVSAPRMFKIVCWQAQRVGSYPTLPDPTSSDPNDTLLRVHISPVATELAPTWKHPKYTVTGRYVYAMPVPKDIKTGGLKIGLNPMTNQATQPALGPANYSQLI